MILDGLQDKNFPQQPVLVAAISYFVSLFLLNFIHINYIFYILTIFILLTFINIFLKNFTFIISFTFICISCIVFSIKFYRKDVYFNSMRDKRMSIICHSIDYPSYTEEKFKYIVEVSEELNNKIPKFKMNLYSTTNLGVDPFRKFKINVYTYRDNDIRYSLYLKSQGIYLSGVALSPYNIEYLDEVKNVKRYLFEIRNKIINYSTKIFDSQCESLVRAFIFGDKKQLNSETKILFYKSGVAHLLAISGFHFSLLIKILYNILKLFNIKKKYLEISCTIFIVLFLLLVGFHPSSVRAGIMLLIYFLSRILFLSYDSLNSLGVALITILLINPDSCTDVGLLLSFISSISIILFSKKLSDKIFRRIKNKSRIINYIISNISDSIVTSVCTIPIIIIYFKYLNSLFIFSNLFIQIQLYAFFIIIFVSIFYNSIFSISFFSNLSNLIAKSIIILLEKFSNLPQINLDYSFINLCISSTLVVISFTILFGDIEKDFLKVSEISFIFFSLGIISYQYSNNESIRLKIIKSKDILISNGKDSIFIFKSENLNNLFYYLNGNTYKINIGSSKIESNVKINSENFYKFSAWNKVKMSIFTINNNLWIRVKIFDKTILICANGADVRYLPENLRTCNIFIAFKLPNKFDIIKCDNMIYVDNFNKENCNKIKRQCLFSNNENFEIKFKNNKYNIKRNF